MYACRERKLKMKEELNGKNAYIDGKQEKEIAKKSSIKIDWCFSLTKKSAYVAQCLHSRLKNVKHIRKDIAGRWMGNHFTLCPNFFLSFFTFFVRSYLLSIDTRCIYLCCILPFTTIHPPPVSLSHIQFLFDRRQHGNHFHINVYYSTFN